MTSNPTSIRRAALCALAFSVSLAGAASLSAAHTWHDVQFGGFFSQGFLETDHNNYPVQTKGGTFDFREYGLNASSNFGTHLRVGGQVFGQTLGKYGDDKPFIDWAQVDYNVRPEFGVRVGRIKHPRSLYSDVLDLDVLRPFVFLPQSIYDNRLRDFQASFDGAMIYGSLNAGRSSFDYRIFYGGIPIRSGSGVADYFRTGGGLYANNQPLKLGIDSVYGATLMLNTPVPGLKFGAFFSRMNELTATGPFFAVPTMDATTRLTRSDYITLSTEYSTGSWTFAAEYVLSESDIVIALPPAIAPEQKLDATIRYAYGSVARRIGEKFEVGTYYTETWSTPTVNVAGSSDLERKDWAFAVRYDVNEHLLFKVEVHAIRGTKDFFDTEGISNPPSRLSNSTTLFAAKTTISF